MYLVEMYILLQSNNSIVTATDTALVPVGYLMCPENEDSSLTASYPHPHARCPTPGRYFFGAPLAPPPPPRIPCSTSTYRPRCLDLFGIQIQKHRLTARNAPAALCRRCHGGSCRRSHSRT